MKMAKKEGRFFPKGHPGYYKGKTVDAGDFILVLQAIIQGRITIANGAEMLNVSIPTFRKWLNLVGEHGYVDRQLTFLVWNDDTQEEDIREMFSKRNQI